MAFIFKKLSDVYEKMETLKLKLHQKSTKIRKFIIQSTNTMEEWLKQKKLRLALILDRTLS
jgi:hypothetical protein